MKYQALEDHICRFNDGECVCTCFDKGFKKARELIKKDLLEIADKGEIEDLRREVMNYFYENK